MLTVMIKEFFATELSTTYEGNLNLDYSILMLQVLWFYLWAQALYFKKEMIDLILINLIPKSGAYGQTVTFYFTAIYFICTAITLYRHREIEAQTRLFVWLYTCVCIFHIGLGVSYMALAFRADGKINWWVDLIAASSSMLATVSTIIYKVHEAGRQTIVP